MAEIIPFPNAGRPANEPWLRQQDAATHLGVNVRTLRKWHASGLPVHRVQGVALYRRSELDAWVEITGRLQKSQG